MSNQILIFKSAQDFVLEDLLNYLNGNDKLYQITLLVNKNAVEKYKKIYSDMNIDVVGVISKDRIYYHDVIKNKMFNQFVETKKWDDIYIISSIRTQEGFIELKRIIYRLKRNNIYIFDNTLCKVEIKVTKLKIILEFINNVNAFKKIKNYIEFILLKFIFIFINLINYWRIS